MATNTVQKESITISEFKDIDKQLYKCLTDSEQYNALVCPRCGGKLAYTEYGASYEVICETNDCIRYGIRGI
jgi:hypothetical protein